MDQSETRLVGAAFLASLVVFGVVGLAANDREVLVTRDLFVEGPDGVEVAISVYEQKLGGGVKPAVLLGHGVMVNKEVFDGLAKELAKAGFLAVALDFRGHGHSGGYLEGDLVNDFLAAKSYVVDRAAERGDVEEGRLGVVGFSMGGGAAFELCARDGDFKAMVGLAPSFRPDLVNATTPSNLLVEVGALEEAFDYRGYLPAFYNRTGLSGEQFQVGAFYGNFSDGTATRLEVKPGVDHLTVPWDAGVHADVVEWMTVALEPQPPYEPASRVTTHLRFAWASLGLLGGVGLAFVLVKPVAGALLGRGRAEGDGQGLEEQQRETGEAEVPGAASPPPAAQSATSRFSARNYLAYSLAWLVPSVVACAPLFLLPPVLTSFFATMFVANLVGVWWAFRREKSSFRRSLAARARASPRNYLLGLLVGVAVYLPVQFFFGLHYLSFAPGLTRWPYVPVYFAVLFASFLADGAFLEAGSGGKAGDVEAGPGVTKDAGGSALKLALAKCAFWSVVILVPCILAGNFFFAIVLILAVPLLLLHGALYWTVTRHGGSGGHAAASLASATFLVLVALSPTPMLNLAGGVSLPF
ncbi:MAG: hypothetical protein Kow0069_15550 [Promethearchaeota archaeon]